MARPSATFDPAGYEAVILDMDGVITDTAEVHQAAWKATFDAFLEEHRGPDHDPFTGRDYLDHVDGKPRYDGVASFLDSRRIDLPYGDPDDPPSAQTVCGVGNRKNDHFHQALQEQGVVRFESTVRFVEELRARGLPVAVISSSRNAHEVLSRAGVLDLFDARVTGVESAEQDLRGKPAPDIFVEAARRLGVDPARAVVVEDAISGVQAGRDGGFAHVIGVDRDGRADLGAHGADLVVDDLGDVLPLPPTGLPRIGDLPPANEALPEADVAALAVFIDYDGTLTPIVDDPGDAVLPDATREVLQRLAERTTVAIVSGRDLADVRAMVGIDGLAYAGSHGFDILRADGDRQELAEDHLDDLDRVEAALRERLAGIDGARVERKRFAVAVHDREVADDAARDRVAAAVDDLASQESRLRVTGGKRIHEFRPDIDWDKGRAIAALIEATDQQASLPVYIGDDETDEDGFRAVRARGGWAVVVRGEDDQRPTLANAALASPADVHDLLADLAESPA